MNQQQSENLSLKVDPLSTIRKFEGVYLIENHRNSLLPGYY